MTRESNHELLPKICTRNLLRRVSSIFVVCLIFISAFELGSSESKDVTPFSPAIHSRDSGLQGSNFLITGARVKSIVFYSYYEAGPSQEESGNSNTAKDMAKRNLRFFIQHGVLGPNAPTPEDATIVFIINGGHISESIPKHLSHVHMLKRPNEGLEFCGVAEALKAFPGGYKYFFMLNSSVRGPFLPNYMPVKVPWTTSVYQMLNDKVKLSGVSINCECCARGQAECNRACYDEDGLKHVHVQSFFLVTDQVGLEIIRPALGCHSTKVDAIYQGEVNISSRILAAGYNIASMDKFWYGHDFTNATATETLCTAVSRGGAHNGDTQYAQSYFGMDHNPYENMFVKVNRGEFPAYQLYTRWSQKTDSRPPCYSEEEVTCAANLRV